MSNGKMLNMVVAVCNNMGIGIEGRLPWRLRQDMAFFKKITLEVSSQDKQNMVIMGRKTWESIPAKFRPLPGRVNVVLSTTMSQPPENALLARSLEEAVNLAESDDTVEGVFIIGGASVYRDAMCMDRPCTIYLTKVLDDFNCDAFFPEANLKEFTKVPNPENIPSGELEEKGIKFFFEVLEKK